MTEKDYGVQLMPLQYVQRIREKKVESHVAGEVVPTQSAPGQNTPGLDRGKMRTIVENTYEVSQSFILDEDEVIYGLGQQQTGKMNQRNQRLVLEQNNHARLLYLISRLSKVMVFIGIIIRLRHLMIRLWGHHLDQKLVKR